MDRKTFVPKTNEQSIYMTPLEPLSKNILELEAASTIATVSFFTVAWKSAFVLILSAYD